MSKIDILVESTARIEEQCKGINARLDSHHNKLECMAVKVTSLEDTRTFQKGMIKTASILSVSIPVIVAGFIELWKLLQDHNILP